MCGICGFYWCRLTVEQLKILRQRKGKTMFEKLLTRSALRVVLSLTVGLAIGLKMPQLVVVACSVSSVLEVPIASCSEPVFYDPIKDVK